MAQGEGFRTDVKFYIPDSDIDAIDGTSVEADSDIAEDLASFFESQCLLLFLERALTLALRIRSWKTIRSLPWTNLRR